MSKRTQVYLQVNTTYDFKYKGLRLPKGAIYGLDSESALACYDYKVRGKNGFYRGLPRLEVWRLTGGKWRRTCEVSPTTYRIYDLWEKYELNPDWGDARHTKYRGKLGVVTRNNFRLYERPLPKGAIYGQDKDSVFFCYDYRVRGRNGYFQGYPRLEVWRPVVGGQELSNQTRWIKSVEANPTTAAILQLYFKLDLEVSWGNQAAEVARNAVNRPHPEEVPYKTTGRMYEKNASGRRIEIIVDATRTLDDVAKKQRYGVYTGTL